MAIRENVKMRGKCVNDTEQFTIIASPVRGQPGSRAVWQSGSVDESGNPVARKQSWRLKVHLNLNAVNAPHSREVGNIKLSDQSKSIGEEMGGEGARTTTRRNLIKTYSCNK